MAAADFFLKIDGIGGESQDDKHSGEIQISSYSHGGTNSGTMASGTSGGGSGKYSTQDFHFTVPLTSASPMLFKACATGQHIDSIVLTVRKAGGEQEDYHTITMEDALISSHQTGGSAGSDIVPTEQYSINFGKITYSYSPQKDEGGLDAEIKAGYDLAKSKAL